MEEPSRQNHHPTLTQASTAGRAGVDFGQFGAPQARRSPRNQKFADSPAERTGFELPVRGGGEAGCRPFAAPVCLGRVGSRQSDPATAIAERVSFGWVPDKIGWKKGAPTRPKQPGASKARQPASLPPRTGSSNPVPSSGESLVNLTSTLIILPSPLWVFDLAAPTGAPIYTKSPGEVSAWGAVGRTCCETDPPATGSGSLVANVGHSRITLPDDVTFRGSRKTRFRMAV